MDFKNRGGGDAFVEFGTNNAVTAVVPTSANGGGSSPILANLPTQQFTIPDGATHYALVGNANCTVYAMRGEII